MQSSVLTFFLALALSIASTAIAQQKTLPYNFTLSALNITLPNANDTGVPLVLGYEAYIIGGVIYFESTAASSPDGAGGDVPLGLVNGALRAYGRDGSWSTNASAITSGSAMGWFSSTWRGSPETNQFTALHAPRRHHKYATLAVHGQEYLWSLCPTGNNGGKNEVFYNISSAAPESETVVPEDCYKVTLQIVPVQ
ncbi:uncharacterized protein SCHCODRAFT_02626135 [Schizophyllum commune H4-8]|nr:uncharacterized protein SCHCODRAFT_02626135 [Schizophyllum commune H4-8]KAI5892421.1 hypothetical protein SCHCODRAFT_02626135 [Schizophyllum commune H4-8]